MSHMVAVVIVQFYHHSLIAALANTKANGGSHVLINFIYKHKWWARLGLWLVVCWPCTGVFVCC